MRDPRTTHDLVALTHRTISRNYAPRPLIMDHGQGVELVDRDGRRFLDFVAGIAVCSLGYNHPRLVDALRDQVGKLLHTSNMFINEPQALLQEKIVARSFADRVYLCNSGAEANEAAIKLARRYQHTTRQAPERVEVVSTLKSFHGRTLGALAATGQPKYHVGFGPMPEGFRHVPFNDLDALEAAVGERTAAVLLEPVQGEGGIAPASKAYLEGARALCDRVGAALIFDEVQCGVGRLGTLWAYESFGVTPDIITWAKGIGGGVPLGVMASNETLAAGFEPGTHASTFGGNPLAARAGLTVLNVIDQPAFLDNVRACGAKLLDGLRELQDRFDVVTDARGMGLMLGLEVGAAHANDIVTAAREHEGLLINVAGGSTLRLVPPLTLSPDHVDDALARLTRAISRVSEGRA